MARTTSPKATKRAGGAQDRKTSGDNRAKMRKKRPMAFSFSIYIYKVLKGRETAGGISSKAMSVMNSFMADIFQRIAVEASLLTKYSKKKTISVKAIESATKLVLNGQLAKHAVDKGRKAIQRFNEAEESA